MSHWKKYDGWDWLRSMWTGVSLLVNLLVLLALLEKWDPDTVGGIMLRGWMMIVVEFVACMQWWAILIRKRQQYPLGLPPLWHLWSEFRWNVRIWWTWKVTGWPFKQRCPQCAGDGTYISEAQARYGDYDGDNTCPMCRGTKFIKRQ